MIDPKIIEKLSHLNDAQYYDGCLIVKEPSLSMVFSVGIIEL